MRLLQAFVCTSPIDWRHTPHGIQGVPGFWSPSRVWFAQRAHLLLVLFAYVPPLQHLHCVSETFVQLRRCQDELLHSEHGTHRPSRTYVFWTHVAHTVSNFRPHCAAANCRRPTVHTVQVRQDVDARGANFSLPQIVQDVAPATLEYWPWSHLNRTINRGENIGIGVQETKEYSVVKTCNAQARTILWPWACVLQ